MLVDSSDRRVLLAKRNAPQSLIINALRFANASYNSRRVAACKARRHTN
jgi:hypothetical protein